MIRRVAIITAAAAVLLAGSEADASFGQSWEVTSSGNTDGLTLADVNGDGKKEIAVVLNGAVYDTYPVSDGTGGLRLLNCTGQTLWTIEVDGDLNGYPSAADLDGDGLDEIVFCETAEEAMCHLVDGDGSILWSQGPYFWPSLWTMGPEIADIDNDGALEVVIPTYGGKIVALDGATGTIDWEYDAWTEHNELFYSRVRLGNVDSDPALEAVVFGSNVGHVVVVDGSTGGLDGLSVSLWDTYGHFAYGNGPTLSDLDGDGTDEIVITALGEPESATLGLDGDGTVLWRTVSDGHMYWTSAGIGDADGDGAPEIYVQDIEGELSQMNGSGDVTAHKSMGGDAWLEPLLVDVTGDLVPEIIAAWWDSMVFHDGSLNVVDSHGAQGAGWWWPVVDDIDNDGHHELVVTAWSSSQVIVLEHPTAPPGGGLFPSGDFVADMLSLFHSAQALADAPGTSSAAADAFAEMSESWWEAVDESVTDDDEDVWEHARAAIAKLLDQGDANDPAIATWLEQLRLVALTAVSMTIERAEAMLGANDDDVLAAKSELAQADSAMAGGDWSNALDHLYASIDAINNPSWRVDNCPTSPSHPELAYQCTLMALATDVEQAAPTMGSAEDKLLDAVDGIRAAAGQLAEGDAEDVPNGAKDAEEQLKDARKKNGADQAYIDQIRADLAATIALVVKRTVGDAERVHGSGDEDYIKMYDAFKKGEADRAAGKYKDAYDQYIEAIDYVD